MSSKDLPPAAENVSNREKPPTFSLRFDAENFYCFPRSQGHKGILRIQKEFSSFSYEAMPATPPGACEKSVMALLGVFHRQTQSFLVVVTDAAVVAKFEEKSICEITRVEFLPFSFNLSSERKARSESVLKEVKALETLLSSQGFFYSFDIDLTRSRVIDVFGQSPPSSSQEAQEHFEWNREMLIPAAMIDRQEAPAVDPVKEWMVPVMCGSVQGSDMPISSSDDSFPPQLRPCKLSLAVISRRSRIRSWPRASFGLDEEGNSADFVETQMILLTADSKGGRTEFSHVSMRGSCPLVWGKSSSSSISAAPENESAASLRRHVTQLSSIYSDHVVLVAISSSTMARSTDESMLLRSLEAAMRIAGKDTSSMDHVKSAQVSMPVDPLDKSSASKFLHDFSMRRKGEGQGEEKRQHTFHRVHGFDLLEVNNFQTLLAHRSLEAFLSSLGSSSLPQPLLSLLLVQWAANGVSLFRQSTGSEPPSSSSGISSRLSGITGGVASSFYSRVLNTASAIGGFASSSSGGGDVALQLLSSLRVTGEEAQVAWRRHGLLASREEELWESRRVKVLVGSWNVNGQMMNKDEIMGWLLPAVQQWGTEGPDLYVLGLQEAVELGAMSVLKDTGQGILADLADEEASKSSVISRWIAEVEGAIADIFGSKKELTLVASRQLVGVVLLVFSAPTIKSFISNVSIEACRTGLRGMAGNKGGVAVRFCLGHTSCCILCAHMAAHMKNVTQRNADYQSILGDIAFPHLEGFTLRYPQRVLNAHEGSRPLAPCETFLHDQIIFFGDLNYRIDGIEDETIYSLIAEKNWKKLREEGDQLSREMKNGRVCWGLTEGQLNFPPTYKFENDSEEYSEGGKGRLPAWCDRILYKGRGINLIAYSSCMNVRGSDHKPVYALMHLDVKARSVPHVIQVIDLLANSIRPTDHAPTLEVQLEVPVQTNSFQEEQVTPEDSPPLIDLLSEGAPPPLQPSKQVELVDMLLAEQPVTTPKVDSDLMDLNFDVSLSSPSSTAAVMSDEAAGSSAASPSDVSGIAAARAKAMSALSMSAKTVLSSASKVGAASRNAVRGGTEAKTKATDAFADLLSGFKLKKAP